MGGVLPRPSTRSPWGSAADKPHQVNDEAGHGAVAAAWRCVQGQNTARSALTQRLAGADLATSWSVGEHRIAERALKQPLRASCALVRPLRLGGMLSDEPSDASTVGTRLTEELLPAASARLMTPKHSGRAPPPR